MTAKTINDLLDEIHVAWAKTLLKKIRNNEATAAELAEARKFLVDNHTTAAVDKSPPIRKLAKELPFVDPTLQAEGSVLPHTGRSIQS